MALFCLAKRCAQNSAIGLEEEIDEQEMTNSAWVHSVHTEEGLWSGTEERRLVAPSVTLLSIALLVVLLLPINGTLDLFISSSAAIYITF